MIQISGHAQHDSCEDGEHDIGISNQAERLALQEKIPHHAAAERGKARENQGPEQSVSAGVGKDDARECKSDGAEEGERPEPIAVEGLMDEDGQGVSIGNAPQLAASLDFIDGVVHARQHVRCLGDSAEHEMDVRGEA
jgi:hypothetical protein